MGNWYIIRTNPQCEQKATGELRRAGVRVYLPKHTYEVRNRKTGKVTVKHRPLYVGYLMIRFTGLPNWFKVRQCQGVKDVLRFMNDRDEWEPMPIPERIVKSIMERQRARDYDGVKLNKIKRQKKYQPGNTLRVADGPFMSFMATVVKLRENGVVEADIDIFGRMTRISFDNPELFLKDVA